MEKRIDILFSSYRRYTAGDVLVSHSHNGHTLHYIAEGEGTFRIGETIYRVKAGDCFLVYEGQEHEMLPVKNHVTVICVRLRFIDPFFTASFVPPETPFLPMPDIKPYLQYVYRNRAVSNPEHLRNAEDILSAILLRFRVGNLTYRKDSPIMVDTECYTKPTRMVMIYIEDRINKKIRFDDMAAELFYNKSYLCETFKAETGMSISEYINFFRIRRAFDRFVFNDYSINDVLYSTGFSSASYFCKVFKKTVCITPGEFLKLLQLVSEEERKIYFTESKLLKFQLTTLDALMENFAQFRENLLELKKRYIG